jgi:exportin-2 (importin alpha re-exporter)
VVVHSYAANAVERLLALKDNGQPRFAPGDLAPLLSALLEHLFAVFKVEESKENEYAMKAVMRIITFVGPQIAAAAQPCLSALAAMLVEVSGARSGGCGAAVVLQGG